MKRTLAEISPAANDRATFYGKTGSGKTTLVKHLIHEIDLPTFVYDWKALINTPGKIHFAGFRRYTTLKDFVNSRYLKKIYAPNIFENRNPDYIDGFWKYVYLFPSRSRLPCLAYLDEVSSIATRDDSIPFYYQSCITRGRESGISVWSATQRPMFIPQIVMSESEHHYVFALRREQDKERIESLCGIAEEKISELKPKGDHRFFYGTDTGDVIGPINLNLKKRKRED